MKRVMLTVLAAMLAILPICAETVTKDYSLKNFTGIRASSVYHVDVSPSDRYSVKVEAPDYLLPYLSVEVSGKLLTLRITEMPKSISRKLSSEKSGAIHAVVQMPTLESVSLSGAAKLISEGEFPTLRNDTFKVELSGASQAKGLSVSAASADIRLSGATFTDITGSFNKISLDASGAGKSRLNIETDQLDIELSGSARVDLDGSARKVRMEASGAAKAELKCTSLLSTLNVECSGASSIDTRYAKAEDVRVELSGASNCKVSVLRSIDIEASGAATCLYDAAPDARVNVIQVARGASVRRL